MDLDFFIHAHDIRPADAIVVKKEKFGILDHYVIYLGKDQYGEHKFIANYTKGIQFLSYLEILNFLKTYVPVRINQFLGNYNERRIAVNRAITRLNENAYNLILNNCEHFANWVQKGLPTSEQVKSTGNGIAAVGVGLGIAGILDDDEKAAGTGLLLTGLGLLLSALND